MKSILYRTMIGIVRGQLSPQCGRALGELARAWHRVNNTTQDDDSVDAEVMTDEELVEAMRIVKGDG